MVEKRSLDGRLRVRGKRGVRNGLKGKLRILRVVAVWSRQDFILLIKVCKRIWRKGQSGIGIGFGRISLLCSLFQGCVCLWFTLFLLHSHFLFILFLAF